MKKIIISYFAFLFNLYTYGQSYEDPRANSEDTSVRRAFLQEQIKSVENDAEFVFEGTLQKVEFYPRTDNNGKPYYVISQIINIKKVYRGNLLPGTVEFIIKTNPLKIFNIAFPYKRQNLTASYDTTAVNLYFCRTAGNNFPYNPKYNIYPAHNKIIITSASKYLACQVKLPAFRLFDYEWTQFFYRNCDFYKYLSSLPNINKSVFTKEDTTFPPRKNREVYRTHPVTKAHIDSVEAEQWLQKNK